jgi:hypothetical protein
MCIVFVVGWWITVYCICCWVVANCVLYLLLGGGLMCIVFVVGWWLAVYCICCWVVASCVLCLLLGRG